MARFRSRSLRPQSRRPGSQDPPPTERGSVGCALSGPLHEPDRLTGLPCRVIMTDPGALPHPPSASDSCDRGSPGSTGLSAGSVHCPETGLGAARRLAPEAADIPAARRLFLYRRRHCNECTGAAPLGRGGRAREGSGRHRTAAQSGLHATSVRAVVTQSLVNWPRINLEGDGLRW